MDVRSFLLFFTIINTLYKLPKCQLWQSYEGITFSSETGKTYEEMNMMKHFICADLSTSHCTRLSSKKQCQTDTTVKKFCPKTCLLCSVGELEANLPFGDIIKPDFIADGTEYDVSSDSTLWPHGIVHYTFHNFLNHSQHAAVKKAMDEIEQLSCVQFKKNKRAADHVIIQGIKPGCFANMGRKGGMQLLNLGSNCWNHGNILHELLHVLGFEHEHNRPDRTQHLIVDYDNIKSDINLQLAKRFHIHRGRLSRLGNFDFVSIMMYPARMPEYAVNSTFPIMIPRFNIEENMGKMGQRNNLSAEDARKINLAYCSHLLTTTAKRPLSVEKK